MKFKEYVTEEFNYKLKKDGLTQKEIESILKETKKVEGMIEKEMKYAVDLRDYDVIRKHLVYLEKMGDMIKKGTA